MLFVIEITGGFNQNTRYEFMNIILRPFNFVYVNLKLHSFNRVINNIILLWFNIDFIKFKILYT